MQMWEKESNKTTGDATLKRIIVLVLMAVLLVTCSGFSSCYLWLDDDEEEERCNRVINSTNP